MPCVKPKRMNTENIPSPAAPEHRHPDTRDGLRDAQLDLVQAARHELRIVAPVLDAAVFNSAAMGEAIGRFVAGRARNRAQVVVEDTEHMLRNCTRFVELARRFSDLLVVRRLGEPHLGLREMFMTADRHSCLRQPDFARVDATLDLHAPKPTGALLQRFEDIWAAAEPVPGLHPFRL